MIMLIYPPTHPGEKCAARGMASSITPADISVEIIDRLSWSPHNVHTLCSHDLRSLLLSLHMQKTKITVQLAPAINTYGACGQGEREKRQR